MNKVFWTYRHLVGDAYQSHEHHSKYCVVALAPMPMEFCICFTNNAPYVHIPFSTKELAVEYATNLLKPAYAEAFETSYDLQYFESDSPEWFEVHKKFVDFLYMLDGLNTSIDMPWYKKLFFEIKKLIRPTTPKPRIYPPPYF